MSIDLGDVKMINIKRNRIKCNHCGDIIESEYVHDFKSCSCGKVSVDGGCRYLKRSFTDSPDDYTEMSEIQYNDCEVD